MAKLYFYYSAMNAGKSTVLLQSAFNYQERGMKVLLFTPQCDTRFKRGKIHSRIGLKHDAITFQRSFNFWKTISRETQIACVLIDEAQFMTKQQVKAVARVVDELNIPVLTYGLRTDYRGEVFIGSQYLLAWADHLIEIKTICHCGKKATMNLRVNKQNKVIMKGAQIKIGGNETYVPVCRKHFINKDIGKKEART